MSNPQQESAKKLLRLSLIFFTVYLGLTFLLPAPENPEEKKSEITFKVSDEHYAIGELIQFEIKNNTEERKDVTLHITTREKGEFIPVEKIGETKISLNPQEIKTQNFKEENIEIFGKEAKFEAQLKEKGAFLDETEFEISPPGFFRSLWWVIFFKPIENLLVFFLQITGGQLWLSIILLTFLVKIIMLVPSKKAILSQQKMQKLQPELEKLKKKYKTDPQKQAQEMMGLWKKHGVNPGSALWPMLLQFPVLIALFFVIKDGLDVHNAVFLYPIEYLKAFDFHTIQYNFLWMDLHHPDWTFILPIFVGVLQFLQMWMMQKKNAKNKKENTEVTPQESMMKMMMYILPVMVVVFSVTFPSAVALYWGVSTVFAIIQQFFLQKKPNEPLKKKEEGEVIDVKEIDEKNKEKPKKKKKTTKKSNTPEKKAGKVRIKA